MCFWSHGGRIAVVHSTRRSHQVAIVGIQQRGGRATPRLAHFYHSPHDHPLLGKIASSVASPHMVGPHRLGPAGSAGDGQRVETVLD